jgi:hypothetical protein
MEALISFFERIPEAMIPLFGIIGAALLGLYWNFHNAKELRKQPFLTKQLELCLEASQVVSILATTKSRETFDRVHTRFLELYWGPLAIVENDEVEAAMVRCGDKLAKLASGGVQLPLNRLQIPSHELAKAVRKLILKAWRITTIEQDLESRRNPNPLPSETG